MARGSGSSTLTASESSRFSANDLGGRGESGRTGLLADLVGGAMVVSVLGTNAEGELLVGKESGMALSGMER